MLGLPSSFHSLKKYKYVVLANQIYYHHWKIHKSEQCSNWFWWFVIRITYNMISLVLNCCFYMYFINKYFTVIFIGKFDKKGVIGIFIFVCNSPGLSMVPSSILIVFGWGKFKYSRMEFWLLTYKKTAFLLVLVHVHGCKSFTQSEVASFLVLYFFLIR